jgi:hypothetical protein
MLYIPLFHYVTPFFTSLPQCAYVYVCCTGVHARQGQAYSCGRSSSSSYQLKDSNLEVLDSMTALTVRILQHAGLLSTAPTPNVEQHHYLWHFSCCARCQQDDAQTFQCYLGRCGTENLVKMCNKQGRKAQKLHAACSAALVAC